MIMNVSLMGLSVGTWLGDLAARPGDLNRNRHRIAEHATQARLPLSASTRLLYHVSGIPETWKCTETARPVMIGLTLASQCCYSSIWSGEA
jgi:hypothetical protein